MADAEGALLRKMEAAIPEAAGYRAVESRADTDRRIRSHVASELQRLREKVEQLRTAAEDEGEEDMRDDLERFDARLARTVEALNEGDYAGVRFFNAPQVSEAQLSRVCAYDRALLEDLELLVNDVMAMKYETIGNLTLREAEGTLAAIEMKVTNRKDAFEMSGDD